MPLFKSIIFTKIALNLLFLQKNAKFRALGVPPQHPRASGSWGLCPHTLQLLEAGGFAPRPPLVSSGWGLRPQTPKIDPPLRISGYAPGTVVAWNRQVDG